MKLCQALLLIGLISALSACGGKIESTPALSGPCGGVETPSERLFLQQISSTRAIVKWRGAANTLCYGTAQGSLDQAVAAVATETGHKEAELTGLTPNTQYYYSVGGAATAPAEQTFNTAPEQGQLPTDGNTKIWIIGDSGTATEFNSDGTPKYPGQAKAVLDGFLAWNQANGGEPVDLFLLLGDNAYPDGTDEEWQVATFEMYPAILTRAATWPTIGNHEMGAHGTGTSSDPNSYTSPDSSTPSRTPYLDIFTLPMAGESGGIPSGTEQYYSFDYGNVHVVSLDSQLSARDDTQRAVMRAWLEADLSANTADWTIVIYHHPPYTKNLTHDSDEDKYAEVGNGLDQPMLDMRPEFIPVFDRHGVDLVYSGHSHSYERSYYITNHTGLSTTFDPATMAELNDSGQPASGQGAEAYTQIAKSGIDDKSVYTVAGSSGKVTSPSPLDHPAHTVQASSTAGKRGLEVLGSVVIDANKTRLDARFIDDKGAVLDFITITR